jgi:uncharacterized membrane protein YeaQ/YmgE (transglycosylase-associated protein family)
MQLSELTKIEAQQGFIIGMLVGVIASWVFIVFYTQWQLYFKVFSSIGEIGICGSLIFSLIELSKARKNYIAVQKEMLKMKEQSQKIIGTPSYI